MVFDLKENIDLCASIERITASESNLPDRLLMKAALLQRKQISLFRHDLGVLLLKNSAGREAVGTESIDFASQLRKHAALTCSICSTIGRAWLRCPD
jgi:hypothetical protein